MRSPPDMACNAARATIPAYGRTGVAALNAINAGASYGHGMQRGGYRPTGQAVRAGTGTR